MQREVEPTGEPHNIGSHVCMTSIQLKSVSAIILTNAPFLTT